MSYQYTTTSTTSGHRLNEFVPNYTVKSDYLPTRVQEQNQGQANEWVNPHICLARQLRKTKKIGPCLHSTSRWVQPQSVRLRQDLRERPRQQTHLRERVQQQSQEILIFIAIHDALLTIITPLPRSRASWKCPQAHKSNVSILWNYNVTINSSHDPITSHTFD